MKKNALVILVCMFSAASIYAAGHTTATQQDQITVTASAPGSQAGGAVTEDTSEYNTTTMSTATGLGLSSRETPQSVSVVTKQRMNDEGLENIADVVNNVTGLSTRQHDSDRYSFSSRGLPVKTTMIDGVSTYYDTRFNYGDNLRDTAIIDRVEVLRGASGLMTGPGAPSASVNIIRKRPTKALRREVTAGFGSYDKWRTSFDLSGPLNNSRSLRGRFISAWQDEHSYEKRKGTNKAPFYAVLEANLTDNTLFTVGTDYQRNKTKGGMFGGLPIFYSDGSLTHYDRGDSTGSDWNSSKTQTFSVFTSLEHTFDNGWNIKGTLTYNNDKIDQDVLWATGFPERNSNAGLIPGNLTRIDGERRQISYDLQASGHYRLFGRQHRLGFGVNHQRQNFQNDYYAALCQVLSNCAPLGDFTAAGWHYPKPEWSRSRTGGSYGRNEETSGYIVTRLSLADPLTLILGSRLTNWKTRGDNFGTPQNLNYTGEFVPYGGLVWDVTDDISLYTSYTAIFDPQNYRNSSGNLLPAVSGKNYEAGIKGVAFNNDLDYYLAVFQIRQDNLAVPDATAPRLADGSRAWRAVNGTKTNGFEAEINGQITDDWKMFVGYTQFRATAADHSRLNTHIPNRQFKLFTTWRLPGMLNKLTIGGGANWQYKTWLNVRGPKGIVSASQKSFYTARFMTRYQFTPDLSLTINLNNLFNKQYYSQFGLYSQYYYGEPRNIEAIVRYQF